jgi:hypothetical protein
MAIRSNKTTTYDAGTHVLVTTKPLNGKLVGDAKTKHRAAVVPAGEYELVSTRKVVEEAGSDYCWVGYYSYAIIRSPKRPELCYEVEYALGGDLCGKHDSGRIWAVDNKAEEVKVNGHRMTYKGYTYDPVEECEDPEHGPYKIFHDVIKPSGEREHWNLSPYEWGTVEGFKELVDKFLIPGDRALAEIGYGD